MRFIALAADYDGTLATEGRIPDEVVQKLHQLRDSGRRLILITGRDVEDLRQICSCLGSFDGVVAENGGVIYQPSTAQKKMLAPPIPTEFIQELERRGVKHLGISSTIVATVKPFETQALEVIRDLGLELKVVFNKSAVMITSPGVTKATGLAAALHELRLSAHNVVGIGDAENDHDFLKACECSIAVANAIPMIKKTADWTTIKPRGDGVMELIDQLLDDDLSSCEGCLRRHHVKIGRQLEAPQEKIFDLRPYGTVALIVGPSGAGKSTITMTILEQLAKASYQFCVLDPEGDYRDQSNAVVLGSSQSAPTTEEIMQILGQSAQNLVINLMCVSLRDRPFFCARLRGRLQELRATSGRPHWLVFDEAHHLFPRGWGTESVVLPQQLETSLLIAVSPGQLSHEILKHVNLVLAVGPESNQSLNEFAAITGRPPIRSDSRPLTQGQALVWRREEKFAFVMEANPTSSKQHRHHRKYTEGLLIPERSFYFRGPQGKLNLRAHNLILFLELADGVDDDTWSYHLTRKDYSQWIGNVIKDDDLASEIAEVEADRQLTPAESRERVHKAIERRYTLPENPSLPSLLSPKKATGT